MSTPPKNTTPPVPPKGAACLTISRKGWLLLPVWVFVNGRPLGLMRNKAVTLEMPPGNYEIGIWIWGRLFGKDIKIGGQTMANVKAGDSRQMQVSDRELWWNLLFNIDMVLWIASFFFTLPSPWMLVYEIVSTLVFLVWLTRIIIKRNRYFVLNVK